MSLTGRTGLGRRILTQMRASTWAWTLWLTLAACAPEAADPSGQPCSIDMDCGQLVCRADLDRVPEDLEEWPLSCGAAGSGSESGRVCERGQDCSSGLCLLAGVCVSPCTEDSDCEPTQRCTALYARSSPNTLATVRGCVARIDLPDDVSIESNVRVSALVHGVQRVELEPTTSEVTTLYVLEHLDDTTWPVPDAQSRCRPPLCAQRLMSGASDASVLFDVAKLPQDGPINPVAVGDYVNPLSVLLPNGPRLQPENAGYTLEVEAKHAGDLRITRVTRSKRGQRLDLNCYYVGAQDLSAAQELGSSRLREALDEVDSIFMAADIFIGDVRQVDVYGALLERGSPLPAAEVSRGFARLRSQYQVLPQLPELFKLSAGAANPALDVFFVADIEASGGDVGGIAGGTPVPWGMHGSPGSGVVIAADMFLAAADPVKLGRTLAHEIGHALGLFHPTEIDGDVFDPLPDTASCALQHDVNGDGLLDARECDGFGADNLMFPTSDATGTQLTPDQIDVIQRAFLLQ